MAVFIASNFLKSDLTWDTLDSLTKVNLLSVADCLGISITSQSRKSVVLKSVARELFRREMLSESEMELLEDDSKSQTEIEVMKLRIKEKELDLKYQAEREVREIKLRELDLEAKRLELGQVSVPRDFSASGVGGHLGSPSFDVTKHIRLVPRFNEREVDKYFLHFEKIAESMKWPSAMWTLLLQSVLVGKAQETYSALSVEDCSNYEVLKAEILKAYELVPEAYRQKFRNLQKLSSQTYVEFANDKQTLLDRWCASLHVDSLCKMRELILIEEFRNSVSPDIKTYLNERDITELRDAAIAADEYTLTHKVKYGLNSKRFDKSDYRSVGESLESSEGGGNGRHPVHSSKVGSGRTVSTNRSVVEKKPRFIPTCSYCHRKGHVISTCWDLQGERRSKSVALCRNKSRVQVNPGSVHSKASVCGCEIPQCYESFVSPGKICVKSPMETPVSNAQGSTCMSDTRSDRDIAILRDTGASQTLLLEGVLTLDESTMIGNVLLEGIGGIISHVPLYTVNLDCKLVKGPVTVGVVPTLPVRGVQLLLGNDLAGGNVLVSPHVVSEPTQNVEMDQLEKDFPHVFPFCAVTRSVTKVKSSVPHVGDVNNMSSDQNDDIPLNDTFLVDLDNIDQNNVENNIGDCFVDTVQVSSNNKSESMVTKSLPGIDQLITEQRADSELMPMIASAVSESEAVGVAVCYYLRSGLLMRKWRPPNVPANDVWKVVHQIIVPKSYRNHIVCIAHESPLAGHMGIRKTVARVMQHFFWPGIQRDVTRYCKACHTCQIVDKPNQKIPVAPLKPIPAMGEPFNKILIDPNLNLEILIS